MKMLSKIAVVAVAALSLSLGGSRAEAGAEGRQPEAIGPGGLRWANGHYYTSYVIYPGAGEQYTFRMDNCTFDAVMLLYDVKNKRYIRMAGGLGNRNPTRTVNFKAGGIYYVVYTSARPNVRGKFTSYIKFPDQDDGITLLGVKAGPGPARAGKKP